MTGILRAAAAFTLFVAAAGAALADDDDPFLWLEEIESEKALDWVRARNAATLSVLEGDPRFAALYQEAKEILTSDARLATGQIHNGFLYNFWQDDTHVRGLWRRSPIAAYRKGAPEWETVLDYDTLAADEGRNWIRSDEECLSPEYRYCMIELSDGGKDAGVWREFDTQTKTFVEDGFFIPEAKSSLAWVDNDTLLVGTDWGELQITESQRASALTSSGYPRQIRRVRRGDDLEEAEKLITVDFDDVWVLPIVEQDGDTTHEFLMRGASFFEREFFYRRTGEPEFQSMPFPPNTDFQGVLDGRLIVFLREPWTYRGATYPQGSVAAFDLNACDTDPMNEFRRDLKTCAAELVMPAADNQSIEDIEVGKSNLVVEYLEDVSGKVARVTRSDEGAWTVEEIKMPANGVISLISVGGGTDDAIISFESLTTPESLFYVNRKNKTKKIAETPAFYDATGVIVEQRFAISADGTKVPYFIMGRDSVLKQGDAPTVQYAYGGFLSPTLPVYYSDPARPQHGALAGKMWVSRGGVLVLSNIRGGSEYGPRWHEAALKANRQRAFDDFIAISEHLIETDVTSSEKLGIIGRSNGGLLMGAMLTQRPELYAAIDIGVPLFDMKRYNKLLAGASWMGEYGNPDIEEEWAYISEYSPYQNLEADQPYPDALFYTSTKDDRVHPGHARKAAAKLESLGYDTYYYENIEGGHGGTANQDQLAYRTALEYTYFVRQLMGEP